MHYCAAHIARKRLLLASGRAPPTSGTAHLATDTSAIPPTTLAHLDGYLDNLAAAATTDRSSLAQLIDSNAALTANLATFASSLASLTAAFTLLSASKPTPTPTAPTASAARPQRNRNLSPNGYCWSHGYRMGVGHNSLSCSNKKEGHKDTATRANITGGSTANKGWEASTA